MAVTYTLKKPYVIRVTTPAVAGRAAIPAYCTYETVAITEVDKQAIKYTGSKYPAAAIGLTYEPIVSDPDPITGQTTTLFAPNVPDELYQANPDSFALGVEYNPFSATVGSTTTVNTNSVTYYTSVQTCTPAQDAVQAQPAVLADLTTQAWDSGARSEQAYVGQVEMRTVAPDNPTGVAVGLAYIDSGTFYTDIEYGYYFVSNKYFLVIGGERFGPARDFLPEDDMHIGIGDNRVLFVQNGQTIYETTQTLIPANEPIFVDVSMYGGGDQVPCTFLDSISNDEFTESFGQQEASILMEAQGVAQFEDPPTLTMVASSELEMTAILDGEIPGKVTMVAESDIGTVITFPFPGFIDLRGQTETLVITADPLMMEASSRLTGIHPDDYLNTMTLPAMTGLSYDYDFGGAEVSLPSMTSFSSGGFVVPELVGANYLLPGMTTGGSMLTGQIDTDTYTSTLPALIGLSSETDYGEAEGTLPSLTAYSFQSEPLNAYVLGEVPAFELNALVTEQPENGMVHILTDDFVFEGWFGGQMSASAPEFELSSTGTVTVVGRVDAEVSFELTASATGGGRATLDAEVNLGARMTAYSGSGMVGEAPAFELLASTTVGGVATVAVDFSFDIEATATQAAFAQAEMVFPEFVSLHGAMYGEFPQFVLNIEGEAVVVRPLTTYVSHLDANAEMTQYSGYDFDSVVYFMGNYYGIKADGMYLLDGATDNGTDIDVVARTQQFDFGTARKKRIPYFYAGSDNDFNIVPIVDGVNYGTYQSTKGAKRVYLPKGATGRYWQFEYQNIDGNAFALDSLNVVVNTLRRKV